METSHRESIESYVAGKPGASTRMVARALGVDDSTADYHLRRLRKEGKVALEQRGREVTWWAAGCGFCPVLRRAIPAFRREGVALTAAALDETPATALALAKRSGLPLGTVRWNAAALVDAGVAVRSGRGRLALAEGARTCIAMAGERTRCDRWGKCALSRDRPAQGA